MCGHTRCAGIEHVVHLPDGARCVDVSHGLTVSQSCKLPGRRTRSRLNGDGLALTAYLLTPALKSPVRIFKLVKCSPKPACAYTSVNLRSDSLQTANAALHQKMAVFAERMDKIRTAASDKIDLCVYVHSQDAVVARLASRSVHISAYDECRCVFCQPCELRQHELTLLGSQRPASLVLS